jgi:hypothetical protein
LFMRLSSTMAYWNWKQRAFFGAFGDSRTLRDIDLHQDRAPRAKVQRVRLRQAESCRRATYVGGLRREEDSDAARLLAPD